MWKAGGLDPQLTYSKGYPITYHNKYKYNEGAIAAHFFEGYCKA